MQKSGDGNFYLDQQGDLVTLSLTPAVQDELGKISFVNFPDVGSTITEGQGFIEVEAEKAVNELVAPLTGVVTEINDKAANDSSVLDNSEPGVAWIARVKISEK